MRSMILGQFYEVLSFSIKDVLFPAFTFLLGLIGGISQHVQKPLGDYRKTLTDISELMLRSVLVL